MKQNLFKVRDFIKFNDDIDVYDDVCEELGIAFCGPMLLTEAGEEHFAEVLDYDIQIDFSGSIKTAAVRVDDDDEKVWKHKLKKASEFFYALAGYCAADDYDKWFTEPEFGQYDTNPDGMMEMTVYCDTTPWFSDEEMLRDNMCEMQFPRKMVQEFYIKHCGGSINSFVEWLQDEYTADDTDGLFAYCEDHGFIAMREDRT